MKELNLESGTFSLGEIASVFAGRLDLFVYSFVGGRNNNNCHYQEANNGSAWTAIEPEVSKCKKDGLVREQAVERAAVVNYAVSVVSIPNAAQG